MGNICDFSPLFTPVFIGNVKIKNRFALSPMSILEINPDWTDAPTAIDYYEERAKGGVGLIFTGAHLAENEVENTRGQCRAFWRTLPRLKGPSTKLPESPMPLTRRCLCSLPLVLAATENRGRRRMRIWCPLPAQIIGTLQFPIGKSQRRKFTG